jgi:iron complex outermembrane receptor protein
MATRGAQTMLNLCYGVTTGTPDQFFCGFVERTGSGDLATVRTARFNLNTLEARGIDFGIGYLWDAGDWGTFRFKYDHTHTLTSEANGVDSVGFYQGAPSFEDRGVLTVDWSKGDWGATWTARYLSDQVEYNCFINTATGDVIPFLNAKCGGDAPIVGDGVGFDLHPNHTGQVVYHDLQVTWKAPWDARIAIGARNAFGKEPPILYNSFAHSFDASYDLPGGAYWYAQYRQDF